MTNTIPDIKPTLSGLKNDSSLSSEDSTYNEAGLTYNEGGHEYGGALLFPSNFGNNQGIISITPGVSIKPESIISTVLSTKPQGISQEASGEVSGEPISYNETGSAYNEAANTYNSVDITDNTIPLISVAALPRLNARVYIWRSNALVEQLNPQGTAISTESILAGSDQTYNEAGLTYNKIDGIYAGLVGYDLAFGNRSLISGHIKPDNNIIGDRGTGPIRVIYRGMPMGLLLAITYNTAGTVFI